ncbi:HIT domain-containing protein [Micrococcales bacterium 31B]|nr:HIT domain-containing protein [Micrococcales bacterium 31B]
MSTTQGLPGHPDDAESTHDFAQGHKRFDHLWTPHRMVYIGGENKPDHEGPGDQCPFCRVPGGTDEKGLIVTRGEHCYVVMNLYPYNSGHVLVCPYRHVADYTDLTAAEVLEVADLTRAAMHVIRSVSNPAGFNLGMNQGAVAGAGIAGHLHQHIVPRWFGDSNFLPVIGETKALPQLLGETRALLAEAWAEHAPAAILRGAASGGEPAQPAPGASAPEKA